MTTSNQQTLDHLLYDYAQHQGHLFAADWVARDMIDPTDMSDVAAMHRDMLLDVIADATRRLNADPTIGIHNASYQAAQEAVCTIESHARKLAQNATTWLIEGARR